MNSKYLLASFAVCFSISLSAQTQSWQWVKAGGSTSDNNSFPISAECKIAGCDAKGNVYAIGDVNGSNMVFDTFNSPGSYSLTGAGISYLLFSYDCAGNMRWAKQIGDERGNVTFSAVVADPQGNTYVAANFDYGNSNGLTKLYLGDTVLAPVSPMLNQRYLCMVKYDSIGKLVWFRNYESDTIYNGQYNFPAGLRIGSSGNLWMLVSLDTSSAMSVNFNTTKKGNYNIEVSPTTGNIISGYYTSNKFYGDVRNPNINWDIDEHENYYETGIVNSDTLRLSNRDFAPNQNITPVLPFVYSLDKHGNFRFIVCDTVNPLYTSLGACKYDMQAHQLTVTMQLDTVTVFGRDTFRFESNKTDEPFSNGLLSIDTNGNVLWGKYITTANFYYGNTFMSIPTPKYISGMPTNGSFVYDDTDTITTGIGSCPFNCTDYYRNIMHIDANGNYITSFTAHLGSINQNVYAEAAPSGAIDWRGNLYLGGSITNYMSTTVGSVNNTDAASGNFFIAKIGISSCSCPTPGVQFTQVVKGDTVYFYGSSINQSDSIHWEFGDGTISNHDSLIHVYSQNGTYTVTAIAYDNCGVDSITKQITVRNVGITAIEPDKTSLYPNPVSNSVNIDVSGAATIGLISANGTMLWNEPKQINQVGTYVFDVSKYSSGVYYFIVQYSNGKTEVLQVVKE